MTHNVPAVSVWDRDQIHSININIIRNECGKVGKSLAMRPIMRPPAVQYFDDHHSKTIGKGTEK